MNTGILYLEAEKRDFTQFLDTHPGYFHRSEDGKISSIQRPHSNPPWIYTKASPNMNCNFWHRILFDVIHAQQKVPIRCQECWKVVLNVKNLSELFAVYLMQKQLDLPSKCGTEIDRPNTEKLYGAYWYTKSLEEGKERFKQVKAELKKALTYSGLIFNVPISAKIEDDAADRLILKRACTEFEQHCGPSDKWTYDEAQKEKEMLAEDAFAQDIFVFRQNDYMIAHVIMSWIHSACKIGDITYRKYTNGNKLFADLLTYHQEIENGKECT